MDYYIDINGNRHVLYPCTAQDCKNKRPSFKKFCTACNKKYKWSAELNKWINTSLLSKHTND